MQEYIDIINGHILIANMGQDTSLNAIAIAKNACESNVCADYDILRGCIYLL